MNNMNNITINEVEVVLRDYLEKVHPKKSNGFIIRLSHSIKNNYNVRKSYIVNFPIDDKFNIDNIINEWSEYAINNIIENYDLTSKYTIISINPISVDRTINKIVIQYSGETISPEELVKSVSLAIIEQMNVHLIETYMDEHYPNIDVSDGEYASLLDELDMDNIYEKYKYADVYVPIKTVIEDDVENNIMFYLNGTINTDTVITEIVDDIKMSLDFNDVNEKLEFKKEDIVYKFNTTNELSNFTIITDANI